MLNGFFKVTPLKRGITSMFEKAQGEDEEEETTAEVSDGSTRTVHNATRQIW